MFALVTRVGVDRRAGNKPCIVRILFGESSGIQLCQGPGEETEPGEGRQWWIVGWMRLQQCWSSNYLVGQVCSSLEE